MKKLRWKIVQGATYFHLMIQHTLVWSIEDEGVQLYALHRLVWRTKSDISKLKPDKIKAKKIKLNIKVSHLLKFNFDGSANVSKCLQMIKSIKNENRTQDTKTLLICIQKVDHPLISEFCSEFTWFHREGASNVRLICRTGSLYLRDLVTLSPLARWSEWARLGLGLAARPYRPASLASLASQPSQPS